MDDDFERPALALVAQAEADIRRRDNARGAFRPFDQTDRAIVEVVAKARIEKLLG